MLIVSPIRHRLTYTFVAVCRSHGHVCRQWFSPVFIGLPASSCVSLLGITPSDGKDWWGLLAALVDRVCLVRVGVKPTVTSSDPAFAFAPVVFS